MNAVLSSRIDFDHLADSPEFVEFTAILKKLTGLVMALNEPASGIIRREFAEAEGNPVCSLIRGDAVGLRRCNACDRRHHLLAMKSGTAQRYA